MKRRPKEEVWDKITFDFVTTRGNVNDIMVNKGVAVCFNWGKVVLIAKDAEIVGSNQPLPNLGCDENYPKCEDNTAWRLAVTLHGKEDALAAILPMALTLLWI